jgi:NAD(P)H-nitrite reductase large subunit
MDLDDEVCLCFRVTRRKLLAHLRVAKPAVASQLSACGGAGTGCGWCVPFLRKLFEQSAAELDGLTPGEYARRRQAYRGEGVTPPES